MTKDVNKNTRPCPLQVDDTQQMSSDKEDQLDDNFYGTVKYSPKTIIFPLQQHSSSESLFYLTVYVTEKFNTLSHKLVHVST